MNSFYYLNMWHPTEKSPVNKENSLYELIRLYFSIGEAAIDNNTLYDSITRAAPKVMPHIYFHGNYNRYKEHNNTT